jgi:LCP family protein required for cell wall assembly
MIICINKKQGNIKILRIPRDIYIGDHYQTGKINSVLSQPKAGLSGEDTLTYELNNIFRLKIDKYVFMDLDVFEQLIDDIGGVTVNLSRPLKIDSARTIKAGRINLDGKLGADFVRHRKSYLTGDIGRIHAQEQFIRQFAIKFRDGKYMKNMPFLNKYYNLVETNIGRKEVGVYTKCFENAKMEDIRTFVIEGTPVMHNGYSVYVADLDKTVKLLNEHFMPEGIAVKKSDIKLVETLQPDQKDIPVKESDHSLNNHYLHDDNLDIDMDNGSDENVLEDMDNTKYTNYNDDSLEEDNTSDDSQEDGSEEESYVPFEE